MSWRDREYNQSSYRDAYSGAVLREWLPPAGTLTILLIHLLAPWFLPKAGELAATDPLGILIHPLLSPPILASLLAAVSLWWLGAEVEQTHGTLTTVGLYAAGNLVAGLSAYGFARAAPALAALPVLPLGALSAWGLLLWGRPHWDQMPVLGRVVSTRRALAILALVFAAYVVTTYGGYSFSPLIAALGGLATGWVYAISTQRRPARRAPPRARSIDAPAGGAALRRPAEAEPDIDGILAKISREGIAALTEDERRLLEAARQAKLRKS